MDYVLIKNGQVVLPHGIEKCDILIGHNKIIDVQSSITRPEPETPIIDATDKFIFPGSIDGNISFSRFALEQSELITRFNQAQVACGTTTVLENVIPFYTLNNITELQNRTKNQLFVTPDYGFHMGLSGWDSFNPKLIKYLYAHHGISSYYLKWPLNNKLDQEHIDELIVELTRLDLLLVVEIQLPTTLGSETVGVSQMQEQLIEDHLTQLRCILELVVKRGCKASFLNICFQEELEIIQQYMSSGRIYVELTLPFNIGDSSKFEVDGNSVFAGFSLINKLNLISAQQFWDLLNDEHFMISRPSLNYAGQGVVKNSQVHNRPDEYFLLKNFVSVLYTSAVVAGHLPLSVFVDVISLRPAKLYGLYPKKGLIRPGSDADLVIWDPDFERNLYCTFPSLQANPNQSFKLKGRAEFVFVKGHMAYNGEAYFETMVGHYLYRTPQ